MLDQVRGRLRRSGLNQGRSASELHWVANALDPRALTICFARRMATYKRAALLLSQPERLRRLLLDEDRPLQFVFAGKAHPADDLGKELIRQIVTFSHDPEVRHRFVFVEDYDMALARSLVQGGDVWLNTPVRPMEASGTSGMKAVMNGALHCSVLDGWWAECFVSASDAEAEGHGGGQRLGDLVGRVDRGRRATGGDRGEQPVRAAGDPDRAAVLRPRSVRSADRLARQRQVLPADPRTVRERPPHGP